MTTIEYHSDVPSLGMQAWISVVLHVACFKCKKGVVSAHSDILAWVPIGASLFEDDVAWNHVLICDAPAVLAKPPEYLSPPQWVEDVVRNVHTSSLLRTEPLSRSILWTVCSTLRAVCCMPNGDRWKMRSVGKGDSV